MTWYLSTLLGLGSEEERARVERIRSALAIRTASALCDLATLYDSEEGRAAALASGKPLPTDDTAFYAWAARQPAPMNAWLLLYHAGQSAVNDIYRHMALTYQETP